MKLSPEYINSLNYALYKNDFFMALDLSLQLDERQSFLACIYCKNLNNDEIANVFALRWFQSQEPIEN